MTDPNERISDDARDVLEAYRRSAPGPGRRRANLEAVRRRVAREEAAARPAAAAAGLAWPIGWGVASAVAAAGLVWGLVELRSPAPALTPTPPPVELQPEVPPVAPSRRAIAPPPEAHEVAEAPRVPAPVQRPARIEPPEPGPSISASDLREETRMLRSVRASIAAGALDDAAATLAEYTVAYPDGALREDAQAYRVVVACKRGDDATALRRTFSLRYPDSPHVARIESTCGGSEK